MSSVFAGERDLAWRSWKPVECGTGAPGASRPRKGLNPPAARQFVGLLLRLIQRTAGTSKGALVSDSTNQTLPERPSLDHLKKQARDLLNLARTNDPSALAKLALVSRERAAPKQ